MSRVIPHLAADNIYEIAEGAWQEAMDPNNDSRHLIYEDPSWEKYARYDKVTEVMFVERKSALLICSGGAELYIAGDIEEDAIVIVSGGSAFIQVYGNIGEGARVLATGGGARIEYFEDIALSAQVEAIGGGACVVRGQHKAKTIGQLGWSL